MYRFKFIFYLIRNNCFILYRIAIGGVTFSSFLSTEPSKLIPILSVTFNFGSSGLAIGELIGVSVLSELLSDKKSIEPVIPPESLLTPTFLFHYYRYLIFDPYIVS